MEKIKGKGDGENTTQNSSEKERKNNTVKN